MFPRKKLQVQIEELCDEIEERKAKLQILERQILPDQTKIVYIEKNRRDICCPGCGTPYRILNELSEDGW